MSQELAWAAGIIEGEGCIGILRGTSKTVGQLYVEVVNTDEEVVAFFQERWPGTWKKGQGIGNRRPHFRWQLRSQKAADFLTEVLPHIRTVRVRTKIELGLEYQAQKKRGRGAGPDYLTRQHSFYEKMRLLNRRGLAALSLVALAATITISTAAATREPAPVQAKATKAERAAARGLREAGIEVGRGVAARDSAVAWLTGLIQQSRRSTWRMQDDLGVPRTNATYAERRTTSVAFLKWIARTWAVRRRAAAKALSALPPHNALWECIHGGEGNWDDRDSGGNGHFGGLQMHPSWGYGTSYLASDDSPLEQKWAAERGYAASGYSRAWLNGQWGQTIGPCWRYA